MDVLTIEEPWKASEVLSGVKPILIVEGMSVGFLPKELFEKPSVSTRMRRPN